MTESNCENVCLAAMALLDGHEAPLSPELIESHLMLCPGCREELAQLTRLTELLSVQKRRAYTEDLWPAIGPALSPIIGQRLDAEVAGQSGQTALTATLAFVILGVLLLSYKLAEMLPQADPRPTFKFIPLLLVIAVFAYLKENPFKINASLRLEGE